MNRYQLLSDKFTALQSREKHLIMWGSFGLIVYLFFWFGISPALEKIAVSEKTLARLENELQSVAIQQQALQEALRQDYSARKQAELDVARKELLAIDQQLSLVQDSFVAADKMPELLVTLLGQENDIKIVNFYVEPSETISFGDEDEKRATVYRHNMRVILQGSFFDLRAYLARLQSSPEKVGVTRFDYTVEAYPQSQLTLELATVSNNQTFIAL